MPSQDEINHAAWTQSAGVDWLEHLQGFTDPGERAAYARVSQQMRDGPILDLGVGAGRTIDLLRRLSTDYVGIDYTPVLVESAHRRHPDIDLRVGDARELSEFANDHFSLVVFSYMGIDSVSHADRQRVLREVHRVLKPGGTFWFSTLNLLGSAMRERPWLLHRQDVHGMLETAVAFSKNLLHLPRNTLNYFRSSLGSGRHHGDGWRVAPFFAYSYGLSMHYITLDSELAELRAAGFQPDAEVFEDTHGARICAHDDLSGVCCFNVLARK